MGDWRLGYWKEALECALEDMDHGLSDEQLTTIAGDLVHSSEMESMASGEECIPNPLRAEINELKRKHTQEIKECEVIELAYRTSVAKRHGVDLIDVHVTRCGKVEVRLPYL